MLVNKGFAPGKGKSERLPPGQYETADFPVLSLGPTPSVSKDTWSLEIVGGAAAGATAGAVDNSAPLKWNWEEFNKLPKTKFHTDIHCVTKWSKFDTNWEGVSLDYLIELAQIDDTVVTHVIAHSSDGYTTNIPLEDLRDGKAIVATSYEGEDIESEHGGPVRLVVPHLYFWKSAKWLTKLHFIDHDEPGFWEVRGYHNYGDPWKEERYSFD